MRKYRINSPQVISEDLSGEAVVINLETGSYYNMGEEAAKIWALLTQGADLDILKNAIQPAKPCDKVDAENHIEGFFTKLIAEGLIKEAKETSFKPAGAILVDVSKLELEVYTDMQDLLGLDPIHEVDSEIGWPVKQ